MNAKQELITCFSGILLKYKAKFHKILRCDPTEIYMKILTKRQRRKLEKAYYQQVVKQANNIF